MATLRVNKSLEVRNGVAHLRFRVYKFEGMTAHERNGRKDRALVAKVNGASYGLISTHFDAL